MNLQFFGERCFLEVLAVLEGVLGTLGKAEISSVSSQLEMWIPFLKHLENITSSDQPPRGVEEETQTGVENTPIFDPLTFPLANLSISDLPLSVRAQNVLMAFKIKNLHELVSANPEKILSSTNCGRKTIGELSTLVGDYLESLPVGGERFYTKLGRGWQRRFQVDKQNGERNRGTELKIGNYVKGSLNKSGSPTLMQVIIEFLEGIDSRNRNILVKRMGLSKGEHRKTLEAVGRDAQITRERVRQIVDRHIDRLARAIRTRRPDIYSSLLGFLAVNKVTTTNELVQQIENLGDPQTLDIEACIRILLLNIPEKVQPLDNANHLWSASRDFTPKRYAQILMTAGRMLKGIPQRIGLVALEVAQQLRLREDEHVEIIKKMLRIPSASLQVECTLEGEIVHPPRQNLADQRKTFIYGYIREQGVPVTTQELFTAMQDSAPELIPDSPNRRAAIHTFISVIERDPRFSWAGSSTWGLTEWGYLTQEKSFRAVVLGLLRSSDRHLSASEIAKILSRLYHLSPTYVPAILKQDKGMTFGRDSAGKWYAID